MPSSSSSQTMSKRRRWYLSSSSSQQKKKDWNFKKEGEGESLPSAQASAIGLKLQTPLRHHFPKLPCVSMFLSLPQSFGDGGEKKEAKPKGEKMNLGLGGEGVGR